VEEKKHISHGSQFSIVLSTGDTLLSESDIVHTPPPPLEASTPRHGSVLRLFPICRPIKMKGRSRPKPMAMTTATMTPVCPLLHHLLRTKKRPQRLGTR